MSQSILENEQYQYALNITTEQPPQSPYPAVPPLTLPAPSPTISAPSPTIPASIIQHPATTPTRHVSPPLFSHLETPPTAHSLRRRRRRREPQMSQNTARRMLVQSSQMRAEAAAKTCHVMEGIGQQMAEITQQLKIFNDTALRIER